MFELLKRSTTESPRRRLGLRLVGVLRKPIGSHAPHAADLDRAELAFTDSPFDSLATDTQDFGNGAQIQVFHETCQIDEKVL